MRNFISVIFSIAFIVVITLLPFAEPILEAAKHFGTWLFQQSFVSGYGISESYLNYELVLALIAVPILCSVIIFTAYVKYNVEKVRNYKLAT